MPGGQEISNLWIDAKSAGKVTMGLGSVAISGAQQLTGASTLALATGAAAASATGIGLIVTGAVITVTTCGLAAVSAHKTGKHLAVLEQIYERRGSYKCDGLSGVSAPLEHQHICDDVLPYIILQKAEKQARKTVSAVPVLGSGAMSAYSLGRYVYKKIKGTLGETRTAMATDLTRHFLTHNCGVAQAIVAELYSYEEMLWLLDQPAKDVIKLLMRKMASN